MLIQNVPCSHENETDMPGATAVPEGLWRTRRRSSFPVAGLAMGCFPSSNAWFLGWCLGFIHCCTHLSCPCAHVLPPSPTKKIKTCLECKFIVGLLSLPAAVSSQPSDWYSCVMKYVLMSSLHIVRLGWVGASNACGGIFRCLSAIHGHGFPKPFKGKLQGGKLKQIMKVS